MTSPPDSNAAKPNRLRKRIGVFVLALVVFFASWECVHYLRFGHFFTYGYHVDLVLDRTDIGVPRASKPYCLRVTNYTLLPLRFEGIRLPEGITDSEVIYHDGLEKWDNETHSWLTVLDSAKATERSLWHPNATKIVWPGRSIFPTGCYDVTTVQGIHPGDIVRIVAFASYSLNGAGISRPEFYSRAFTAGGAPTTKAD